MILIVQEDYINTSHPNFIGGSKAVEQAQQQVKAAKISAVVVRKVCICCVYC
jgi:dynamin 1-like protein